MGKPNTVSPRHIDFQVGSFKDVNMKLTYEHSMEMEAQRKDEERQGEEENSRRTKETYDIGNVKGIFFEEALLAFEA